MLLAAVLGGCAIMNRDNTPTLNLVEDKLWPESTAARIAVSPLVFPVGLGAALVDACVVHPVSVADDAAEITSDNLWEDLKWDDRYVTECAALPWRALSTPVLFGAVFLTRSLFDIPRYEPRRDRAPPLPENSERTDELETARAEAMERFRSELEHARALLDQGQPDAALAVARALLGAVRQQLRASDRPSFRPLRDLVRLEDQALLVVLAATWKSGNVREIRVAEYAGLVASRHFEQIGSILTEMSASSDAFTRWTALALVTAVPAATQQPRGETEPWPLRLLRKGLADPEPLVRCALLSALAQRASEHPVVEIVRELRSDLERLAAEDPAPLIRALAELLVRGLPRE
ncbi:MAG: hypothetical protein JXB32_24150 [Deltaproteobacteria bacterium]|nr:hypothetical protein [Deltaproteobacteria bacterium]